MFGPKWLIGDFRTFASQSGPRWGEFIRRKQQQQQEEENLGIKTRLLWKHFKNVGGGFCLTEIPSKSAWTSDENPSKES